MGEPNPLLAMPEVDGWLVEIEAALQESVVLEDTFLSEVSGHLIKAGGKRQRPLFACLAAATRTQVTDDVILGGVAVELVQVGSLYHDDVIDEAPTRRGVESVNARWGNLVAILSGDYLLAKASEIAASLGVEVAGLLARTIGELCAGEVRELRDVYNLERTEDHYYEAITGKTAALFATACRIGGIVGRLDRAEIDALTAYGRSYGMAFQIVDDILDVVATSEELGKPAGLDLAEGVYNLPTLRALHLASNDELRSILGKPLERDDIERARKLVQVDGAIESAVVDAQRFVDEAFAAIAPFDGPAADAMRGGAQHLLTRFS